MVCALGAAAGIGPADDGEAFGPHVLHRAFGTTKVSLPGRATVQEPAQTTTTRRPRV